MATIYHLRPSITDMLPAELTTLITTIRATRRTRPPARRAAPAKVARAPKKGSGKQHDLFQLAQNMTPVQKAALAAQLMKEFNL